MDMVHIGYFLISFKKLFFPASAQCCNTSTINFNDFNDNYAKHALPSRHPNTCHFSNSSPQFMLLSSQEMPRDVSPSMHNLKQLYKRYLIP